ncbi:hypothetical protein [Microbacterium sp. 77mftsu3.1]|uniref:hypothetical protein n=1 Tax=Microbacterium sp. 77mftsu3.1 TaxID=1761802 RepID=UPI00037259CF|nr:hypothetical protein [Microbacterium sp. 77mftsu3.1]SDH37402.1 hypothetical protein SAMN04488590_3166 [Microbacterium sp. 77mftsu3.1]
MTIDTQARDRVGRFAESTNHAPEVTLAPPATDSVLGSLVSYNGIPSHRIIEVGAGSLTLRAPDGSRVMATADEVEHLPEDAAAREVNIAAEANVARLLISVRGLSRYRKDDLDAPTGRGEREALDALATLYVSGQLPMERYVYAMRASERAPLAAQHAALSILARPHLTTEHYDALTERVRRAGGVLPD